MARSEVAVCGTASNMEGSSREQPTKGGPSAWGLDEVLTNPHHQNWPFTKRIHVPRSWTDPMLQPKQWKGT